MKYYCLTTRNIKRQQGSIKFQAEPGEPAYLIADENAGTFSPDQQMGSATKTRGLRWAKAILADAHEGLEEGECGDIVFLVHGYNVNEKQAFTSHGHLAKGLRDAGLEKAVFVSYDWPAKGKFINYLEDDSDARFSAIHLVQSGLALFARLSEPSCRIRLHVVAHSMGALVVREAIRAAAGNPETREAAWGITQLILYGADISKASLGNSEGAGMLQHSQRLTSYFNRHDKALATSNVKRFLSSPRAGRHGAPDHMLGELVDVDTSEHWKDIAATNEDGFFGDIPKSHTFYSQDETWLRDVALTIKGDLDRRELPTRRRDGLAANRMILQRSDN